MISLERGDFMKNLKKAMLVVAMSVLVLIISKVQRYKLLFSQENS